MSDTFDHEQDAWDSRDNGMCESYAGVNGYDFTPDSLFYHTKIRYCHVLTQTTLSYLVVLTEYPDEHLQVWIPKSIIKNCDNVACTMYVHKKTYDIILEDAKKNHG